MIYKVSWKEGRGTREVASSLVFIYIYHVLVKNMAYYNLHIDKKRNYTFSCHFLAPTGAQEVLIFVPYHRLLRTISPPSSTLFTISPPSDWRDKFLSISDSLKGKWAEGGDLSHLKVVIWVIWRWWSESSEGGDMSHLKVMIWVIWRWW